MYNQLYEYFDNILFPSQCGFWKGYSVQHCLLVMIEKFKEAIARGNEFGALLTDLSKAFDCINHPLFIARLYNSGVPPLSFNMIFLLGLRKVPNMSDFGSIRLSNPLICLNIPQYTWTWLNMAEYPWKCLNKLFWSCRDIVMITSLL